MAHVELAEIDPVCGMKVLPEKAAASVQHAGRTWYFCSKGCGTKFEADPGKYDSSQAVPSVSVAPTTPASAQYTCPMHPEVRAEKPGSCPKCGMTLEPVDPASTAGPNTHARCIPRSCAIIRAIVPFAAWRLSRAPYRQARRILN